MLGIIGGSGFYKLDKLQNQKYIAKTTELGDASADILLGELSAKGKTTQLAFLARHGIEHNLAPHKINYRANILALKNAGVDRIIALHSVGAIDAIANRTILMPKDLIDYTHGREASFFDGDYLPLKHTDFSYPFCKRMQNELLAVAQKEQIELKVNGAYGVTQGIRLETPAEIARMRKDGATIVGMTLMPEAILARELEIDYVSLSIVVNPAAGVCEESISLAEIEENLNQSTAKAEQLIFAYALAS